ncbi:MULTISPECIES: hypothetical protein [Devosia]|uniref:hypothetical protein n=1 Tax=Devosia TaxID=46913 RepID=UPI000CE97AA1|nr:MULTISPECIES: hypothetical protein [Devosia]AVF04303.1 hypothetical protein C4375_11660 [Devosia sp. I507]
MYNTPFPTKAELPTTERLIRSTAIAAIGAVAILVTIVLPSEYGIDVTGVGRLTGLTAMGEIKIQLAEEAAAADALSAQVASGTFVPTPSAAPDTSAVAPDTAELEARVDAIEQLIEQLQTPQPVALPPLAETPVEQVAAVPMPAEPEPQPPASLWRDEISFTLTPGEGTEYKLVMQAGAVATYEFLVDGGVINYDAHGEGEGQSLSYEQGRGVAGDSGQMVPPVSGTHGWFFRNRGAENVTVTLRTGGDYSELRKLI